MAFYDDLGPITSVLESSGLVKPKAQRQAEERLRQLEGKMPTEEGLTPEYFGEDPNQYLQGEAQLAGAGADPESIAAQRDVLRRLEEMGEGGFTTAERANINRIRGSENQFLRGHREAALQDMQERGMGGSNQELLARLTGQQQAANRISDQDAQLMMGAQNRALGAIEARGGLASGMRGQSFGEDVTRRQAADEMGRYNTDYQRGIQQRNTEARRQQNQGAINARQQAYNNRSGLVGVQNTTAIQGQQNQAQATQQTAATGASAAAGIPPAAPPGQKEEIEK